MTVMCAARRAAPALVVILGCVMTASTSHAQGSNVCGPARDPRTALTTQPTGAARCQDDTRVFVSRDLVNRCIREQCVSTAPDTRGVSPKLYFEAKRFTVSGKRGPMTVRVCYTRETYEKMEPFTTPECPTDARDTYSASYAAMPENANWSGLAALPQCFVLKWDDGSESTPFAVKRSLTERKVCR